MRVIRPLLVASFFAATFAFAPASRAHDPAAGLEKADQVEAEGRSLIEHGHRVEGAKTMAQAWRIRAEVWGAEQAASKSEPRPELGALKEKIERIRAASNDAEKAGHELKTAGKLDEANAKMEESGRLWREADEMQKKLEEAALEMKLKQAAARQVGEMDINGLKAQAGRAREEAAQAAADAARADAEGKEEAAKAATDRARRLKERVRALEAAIHEAAGQAKSDGQPGAGIEAQLVALRRQMEEMRAIVEDLRKRIGDQSNK